MGLHFSVLASGSTGNMLYVGTDEKKLLVDAGLSGKATEALFKQAELNINDVSGILVTHEHSDHIKGLGVLARKYDLPVYANEKTWNAMEHLIGNIPTEQKFIFSVGDVKHSVILRSSHLAFHMTRQSRCSMLFITIIES